MANKPVSFLTVDMQGTTRGFSLVTTQNLLDQCGNVPVYLGNGPFGAARLDTVNGQPAIIIGTGAPA